MKVNLDDLDRIQKAVLWVMARMQELVTKGYVSCTPGSATLNANGLLAVAEMERTGYEPTEAEMLAATAILAADGRDDDAEANP